MSAPEAMTYASLKADIQVYTERADSDFTSQIDRFIMFAEQRLAVEAKGLGFIRVVNGRLNIGNPVIEKPQRWRQTREFFYVNSDGLEVYLLPRKYGYCRVYAAGEAAAPPEYYANYDWKHYFIARKPDKAYSFELSYFERPEPLSEASQTNWTTINAPQLLLYASLLEAQPFLKNTSQLGVWQAQYAQMLASLHHESAMDTHDASESA